jgi:hypothetical protein
MQTGSSETLLAGNPDSEYRAQSSRSCRVHKYILDLIVFFYSSVAISPIIASEPLRNSLYLKRAVSNIFSRNFLRKYMKERAMRAELENFALFPNIWIIPRKLSRKWKCFDDFREHFAKMSILVSTKAVNREDKRSRR